MLLFEIAWKEISSTKCWDNESLTILFLKVSSKFSFPVFFFIAGGKIMVSSTNNFRMQLKVREKATRVILADINVTKHVSCFIVKTCHVD